MKKVLFLDIDGVLRRKDGPPTIAADRAQLIHEFAETNKIAIAISSTWRLAYDLSFFQRMISPRVIGKLPGDSRACDLDLENRGKLIRLVVEKKLPDFVWAILDDDPELFPEARDQQRCVFVDKEKLVTKADLDRVGRLLNC